MTEEERNEDGGATTGSADEAAGPTADGAAEGASGGTGDGAKNGNGAQGGRQSFADGIKQGIGVLGAFKDALEETIQEARDRGDLSSEKAREVMKDALDRAQNAAEGARERLDFATQAELRALSATVEALTQRVATLEAAAGIEPAQPSAADESATSSESEAGETEE